MKNHDKIATRLALILNKFNSGEKFSIDNLVEEFNVTKRTIQRDLSQRLSYLPIKKENNLYYLEEYYLGKLNFDDIKNFAVLSGIKELYPSLQEDFLKNILDDTIAKAYIIKGHNYEDVSDKTNEFKLVEESILSTSFIIFTYNDKSRVVKPYKLLNTKGIWYLIATQDEEIKTFSFKKITKLEKTSQTFKIDQSIIDKINNDDNVWFSNSEIEVVLKIRKEVANYFLRRKIIPYQIVLKELDDKGLLVSCKVSFDEEILKIVRYWIPNVEIISPDYLKEKLGNSLKEYLKI
jgi:predicted DNA-binding transcriptional regulator YafY